MQQINVGEIKTIGFVLFSCEMENPIYSFFFVCGSSTEDPIEII